MMAARQAQRATLRRRRAGLDPLTRHTATTQIVNQILDHKVYRRARCVALYCATGSEVDLWPVIRTALHQRKKVCLPRVRGAVLDFLEYDRNSRLLPGAFGLLQPASQSKRVAVRQIDLVITPLVGFANGGLRLGQGGGYYDRALACRRASRLRRPFVMGAAFALQRCDQLQPARWDVPMDALIRDNITAPT